MTDAEIIYRLLHLEKELKPERRWQTARWIELMRKGVLTAEGKKVLMKRANNEWKTRHI